MSCIDDLLSIDLEEAHKKTNAHREEHRKQHIPLDDLKVGDWVRFYTNSMREPTSTTRLAQITGFIYSPPVKRLGIPAKRIAATAINAVDRFDEIGDVIEVNPEITKGISLI